MQAVESSGCGWNDGHWFADRIADQFADLLLLLGSGNSSIDAPQPMSAALPHHMLHGGRSAVAVMVMMRSTAT